MLITIPNPMSLDRSVARSSPACAALEACFTKQALDLDVAAIDLTILHRSFADPEQNRSELQRVHSVNSLEFLPQYSCILRQEILSITAPAAW